jgi:GT2 family glycosyltransferase
MKLSVIIVNYNVKHFLEQCLYSVLRAIQSVEAEVIVVDNNSTDGSLQYLEPIFSSVQFIKSKENLGFGKANNLALQSAKGEYILFLNPDTLVPEDCFIKCIHFLESQTKAGALGIRMLDGTGKFLPESKRSFPDTTTAFLKLTSLSSLFPDSPFFNKYALGHLSEKENHKVDVLAGAFMFFKRSAIEKIGGFDEAFFMYGEDIDLSYRCKLAGFDNWYFAESSIIHFKGESAKQGSLNYVKMFYQAMIIFVNKHYQGKGSGFFRLFLNTAIAVRGTISWFRNSIAGIIKNRPERKSAVARKVIVGTIEEYNSCIDKIQHFKSSIAGRISIENNEENSLGSINQLTGICEQHQIREIIFIYGTLSLSRIIEVMQQSGSYYSYQFHFSKSSSIVGSNSKNDVGAVISFQEVSSHTR